jgi:hypothetical protein
MKILTAIAIAAVLVTSPVSAQPANKELEQLGDIGVFMMFCPKHFERLPPRTQRIIISIGESLVAKYDDATKKQAAINAYAKGYDKQGEAWCAAQEALHKHAGNF